MQPHTSMKMSLCNTSRFLVLAVVLSVTILRPAVGFSLRHRSTQHYTDLIAEDTNRDVRNVVVSPSDINALSIDGKKITNNVAEAVTTLVTTTSDNHKGSKEKGQELTSKSTFTQQQTQSSKELEKTEIDNTRYLPTSVKVETTVDELTTGYSKDPTTLIWKEYTMMDKLRSTLPSKEMSKSASTQKIVSLEEAFFTNLGVDFIATKSDQSATTVPTTPLTETISTNIHETTIVPTAMSTTSKLESLLSQRGGYLDFSQSTTTETTTAVELGTEKVFENTFKTETTPADGLTYLQSTRDPEANVTTGTSSEVSFKQTQNDTEETKLAVKPINHEKKNIGIYTVSPNYKPLKKIEVQPPKPFVRDPDDNSWRNESISSLGIVFKPKNASKAFTEVIKNKTKTEMSAILEKEKEIPKNDTPELRDLLVKISELRKSTKKKSDTSFESEERDIFSRTEAFTEAYYKDPTTTVSYTTTNVPTTTGDPGTTENIRTTTNPVTTTRKAATISDSPTTRSRAPQSRIEYTTYKPGAFIEYYDSNEDEDHDYFTFPDIDIKKFPFRNKASSPSTLSDWQTKIQEKSFDKEQFPERKPTIQYFPPRKPQNSNLEGKNDEEIKSTPFETQHFTIKDAGKKEFAAAFNTVPPSDKDFHREKDIRPLFTSFSKGAAPFKSKDETKSSKPYFEPTPIPEMRYGQRNKEITSKPSGISRDTEYTPMQINKNMYLTEVAPQGYAPLVTDDGSYNRASYAIDRYREFINSAAKEYERNPDYSTYTEQPMRGVTVDEHAKGNKFPGDDYDYDTQFRKEVIDKFVENFNRNSERFKVDFPTIYNSSVVHHKDDGNNAVSSSRAFMKRIYDEPPLSPKAINTYLLKDRPCEPNCEKMTVELSPAYELHYYVPEQEENDEVEPRPTPPGPFPHLRGFTSRH